MKWKSRHFRNAVSVFVHAVSFEGTSQKSFDVSSRRSMEIANAGRTGEHGKNPKAISCAGAVRVRQLHGLMVTLVISVREKISEVKERIT